MKYAVALIALLVPAFASAQDVFVLPYQAQNHWVAVSDNVDQNKLAQAAKEGHSAFYFSLPEQNRQLSVQRLVVLAKILEKYAGHAVNMIEAPAEDVPSNTIHIRLQLPATTPAAEFTSSAE